MVPVVMQNKTLLQAVWAAVSADYVPMAAATFAFYAVFGLLATIAAAAALWGQFGDLNALHQSALADKSALPTGMADLLSQFLRRCSRRRNYRGRGPRRAEPFQRCSTKADRQPSSIATCGS